MYKILQEARQLLTETDQKIKDPALSGTESAWVAINFADKMSVMLPELLAYAEIREAQAIEATAKALYPFSMPTWDHLPEEDYEKMMFSGKSERFFGKNAYRTQAAKLLDAEASAWHKITEEEKSAIRNILKNPLREDASFTKIVVHNRDLEILRGMIK